LILSENPSLSHDVTGVNVS